MIAAKVDAAIPKVSNYAFAFLAGFFVSCWWFQTGTFEKVEKALPAVQAEADCEHWRANVASKLATQPTIVDPAQIPKDYCDKPSTKK